MSDISVNELFNFISGSDATGESAYDIWKSLNPNGDEEDFLEYLRSRDINLQPGSNITIENGIISVVTTDVAEADNTKPITSAGVNTIVGNIEELLKTL